MEESNSNSADNFTYSYPLVYYYRRSNPNDDEQIKYSIRTACKNLNPSKVIIIGDKPTWFIESERAIHIDSQNPLRPRTWTIGWVPFLHFCNAMKSLEDLGIDDFLLMNDDFFILKPIKNWIDLERSEKSYREKTVRCKPYHIKTLKVFKIVTSRRFFNLHAPMRMRVPYVKILCLFWTHYPDKDLDFRNFYGNLFLFDYPKTRVMDDRKILDDVLLPEDDFISTSSNGYLPGKKVYEYIHENFKKPSFCERPVLKKIS